VVGWRCLVVAWLLFACFFVLVMLLFVGYLDVV